MAQEQPTPRIIGIENVEITFTEVTGADNYTVFYTTNGTDYTEKTDIHSPIYLGYSPTTECGRTLTGYIVTNCTNGLKSLHAKLPDLILPSCPPPPLCSSSYQPMVAGITSAQPVTRRINPYGVYNQSSAGVSIITLTGGSIYSSILGTTGFYLAGDFATINGSNSQGIGKLLCTSIVDPDFIIGTGLNKIYSGNDPRTLSGRGFVITNDFDTSRNRVYVGGDFSQYNGIARNNFAALNNATGAIDPSFVMGTGFQNEDGSSTDKYGLSSVKAIVIQPDGKILVGGAFHTYNGAVANRLIRLNTDGTKDPNFTAQVFLMNGSAANSAVNDIALDTDGSIFVTGYFTKYGTKDVNYLVKLTSTGTVDPLFDTGTKINNLPGLITAGKGYKLLIQDTFIIVIGIFTQYNTTVTKGLIRLNKTTAALDPTYRKDIFNYAANKSPDFQVIKKAPIASENILLGGITPNGFQGDTLRISYYVLKASTLEIDVLDTPIGGPVSSGVYDILITNTP